MAKRRGLPFLCPCLCRVQPTDTSRRCALGGQIDQDRLPCCHVQSANTTHRCVPGAEPCELQSTRQDLWKLGSRVVHSGRRVPVWFLDFGIGETFFVPVDPASPCRARSQTVLLDRAQFQIVLRDRALMPGSSRTRARPAKSSPRSTTSAIFLHRCAESKTRMNLESE